MYKFYRLDLNTNKIWWHMKIIYISMKIKSFNYSAEGLRGTSFPGTTFAIRQTLPSPYWFSKQMSGWVTSWTWIALGVRDKFSSFTLFSEHPRVQFLYLPKTSFYLHAPFWAKDNCLLTSFLLSQEGFLNIFSSDLAIFKVWVLLWVIPQPYSSEEP